MRFTAHAVDTAEVVTRASSPFTLQEGTFHVVHAIGCCLEMIDNEGPPNVYKSWARVAFGLCLHISP